MKNNRFGQAAILSYEQKQKIRNSFEADKYKLFWDIACYTGERWGAICQLLVRDVYDNFDRPRKEITFRSHTRKADTTGKRKTRQVQIHPVLERSLLGYKVPESEFLFPSDTLSNPITFHAAQKALKLALEKAKLSNRGISTHSTRRTFITELARAGVGLDVIQAITGHRDVNSLRRYIEDDPTRIKAALMNLS